VVCKRNDELRAFQATTIEHLIDIGKIETGKRVNQVGDLQRPGDSRWSTHLLINLQFDKNVWGNLLSS